MITRLCDIIIRSLVIALALVLVVPLVASTGPATRAPAHAQDDARDPLAALLAFAPDTPDARQLTTYGDIAAWHEGWGVPRPLDLDTLDMLPRIPRAYWMNVMPRQVVLPPSLGAESLFLDDQRAFYGFDVFQVDRVLSIDSPPDTLTVLEHNTEPDAIAAQLLDSGYSAEERANGWTLYSILGDNETALNTELDLPNVGQVGQRNRIALNGQQLLIARNTATIDAALDAAAGDASSLLDDPAYAALVEALHTPLLDGTGAPVGVIFQDGQQYSGDFRDILASPTLTAEALDALRAEYGLDDPDNLLPLFNAVAFATSHAEGATYLTLALAFPTGTDTDHALDLLTAKLPEYTSLRTETSLAEQWTFDRSGAITVGDIPVTLFTLRNDDPVQNEDDAMANTRVLTWYELVVTRDVLFLAAGPAASAQE